MGAVLSWQPIAIAVGSFRVSWAAIVINGDGVIECDLALNMHDHVGVDDDHDDDERLS